MKGICQIWSRGRHFSPSLPDGGRLVSEVQLTVLAIRGPKSRGPSSWYDALAPRPEVLLTGSCFFPVSLVLCLRMTKFSRTKILSIIVFLAKKKNPRSYRRIKVATTSCQGLRSFEQGQSFGNQSLEQVK